MVGALRWTATIDLANPVLADEPTFVLLEATRLKLMLPHGGQVRRDGSPPPLAAADINITVGGLARTLTTGAPAGNQFSIDATIGTVTFGSALPPTGMLVAEYFLGQWEQRLARIAGTLRIDVCAASVNDVRKIAEGIVSALEAPLARTTIGGLYALSVRGIGSVGPRVPEFANSHRRTLRFAFVYEAEINRPDSSGGIIKQIRLIGRQPPPPPPRPDDSQLLEAEDQPVGQRRPG